VGDIKRQLIPGECDTPEWVRAALVDYGVFISAQAEAWALWHERLGVAAPAAHSLDAEACIVPVGLFRNFYDGLLLKLAPYFYDLSATSRLN
jgi:hypothetical protein